jgi:hypothetical protein
MATPTARQNPKCSRISLETLISEAVMRREACLLSIVLALSSNVQGQTVPAVTVRGTVVDAVTSVPISGAQLTLTSIVPSAVLPPSGASPVLTGSRIATTDSAGGYEIRGVASGEYRLLVRRLGYRAALVDLDASAGNEARISFGLVVTPVRLQAVRVDADRLNLFGRLSLAYDTGEVTRPSAALARQAEYLSTDVRELTALGAIEGASLGEIDIFRALRRMPGISGADDHSTALWVRGAQWDQVRVSFDGMPLFNPFHAPRNSGGMTGISGDAIGAAFLHPGVRPVSLFGQGPSLVDIRSRAPTDTNARFVADASIRSLSTSFEKASRSGRTGISMTARRDLTNDVFSAPRGTGPFGDYAELALRADHDFGGGKGIELSHLLTRDYFQVYPDGFGSFRPGLNDQPRGNPDVIRSGTRLVRGALNLAAGGLRISHTVGYSAYESRNFSMQFPVGAVDTSLYFLTPGNPVPYFSRVNYVTLRGALSPLTAGSGDRWSAGYELSTYRASSQAPRHAFSWWDLSIEPLDLGRTLALGALWGERRWRPTSALTMDGGIRLESDRTSFEPRLAPSLVSRLRLDEVTTVSAGLSRNYQDTQELPFSPAARSNSGRGYWLLSGRGVPSLRADQAHAGIDRWVGESVLVDLNAYARRLTGVASRPAPAGDSVLRPLFESGVITAYGLEASARKLSGRFTGGIAYSYGKATERIDSLSFPAPADRRHTLDATSMVRLGRFRLGGGATYMTGAPYTRTYSGYGVFAAPDSIHWVSLPSAEAPGAQRFPSFFSLDLFTEMTARIKGVGLTTYFGMQNITDHTNFTSFLGRPTPADDNNLSRSFPVQPNGDYLYWSGSRTGNLGLRIVF